LGFSIILPLLPYFADSFDITPSLFGCLLASNAFSQLIGAPILGRLSDRYGRRPILLICIGSTFVSFVMLAMAQSVTTLFLSRIIDGALGGNISLAQAYISDVTQLKERTRALGFVGAAFGIGFILGPAIGGSLAMWGYRLPAVASSCLAGINLIGAYLYLEESLPLKNENEPKKADSRPGSIILGFLEELKCLWVSMKRPRLGLLLVLRFLYSFIFTLYESSSGHYNKTRFQLSARDSSYLLCYVGLIFALMQGSLLHKICNRFTETQVTIWGGVALAVSLWGWAFAESYSRVLLVLVPFALAAGTLNTLINSMITKQVAQHETGGTLGLSASIGSLTRILAPLLSGFLIERLGDSAPGVVGCMLASVLSTLAFLLM